MDHIFSQYIEFDSEGEMVNGEELISAADNIRMEGDMLNTPVNSIPEEIPIISNPEDIVASTPTHIRNPAPNSTLSRDQKENLTSSQANNSVKRKKVALTRVIDHDVDIDDFELSPPARITKTKRLVLDTPSPFSSSNESSSAKLKKKI